MVIPFLKKIFALQIQSRCIKIYITRYPLTNFVMCNISDTKRNIKFFLFSSFLVIGRCQYCVLRWAPMKETFFSQFIPTITQVNVAYRHYRLVGPAIYLHASTTPVWRLHNDSGCFGKRGSEGLSTWHGVVYRSWRMHGPVHRKGKDIIYYTWAFYVLALWIFEIKLPRLQILGTAKFSEHMPSWWKNGLKHS